MRNKYKAYYNPDLMGANDGRDFGVEIYLTGIDGDYLETVEYRFFNTKQQAEKNAKIFNEMQNKDYIVLT